MKKSVLLILLLTGFLQVTGQPLLSPAVSSDWRLGGNNPSSFVMPNVLGVLGTNSELWATAGGSGKYPLIISRDGKTGFSDDWPDALKPTDRIHIHSESLKENFIRFTDYLTGTGIKDGTKIGMIDSGITVFDSWESRNFAFRISNSSSLLTKFTIKSINQTNIYNPLEPSYNNETRVGIWSTHLGDVKGAGALSMLHIGTPSSYLNLGTHRDWMNKGTFYNNGNDGMYVGIRPTGSDAIDAVIAWGDNPLDHSTIADRLKFHFNAHHGWVPGDATSPSGLEVARMTATFHDGQVMFNGPGGSTDDAKNTVHIYGQSPKGNAATSGGNSGLRLQFVNTSTPPVTNPGPGVLSVDANGDVQYVHQAPALGGVCATTGGIVPPIPGDWNIPMNGHSVNFTCDVLTPSRVNIGSTTCGGIGGRFNVYDDNEGLAGRFYSENNIASSSSHGLDVMSFNYAPGSSTGISCLTNSASTTILPPGIVPIIVSGHFEAFGSGSGKLYGVYAQSQSEITANLDANYGVFGRAVNDGTSKVNIGLAGIAENAGTIINSSGGSPTSVPIHINNIGIYSSGDWSAMHVGDALTIGGGFYVSDRKLKDNISPFMNARQILDRLQPVTYTTRAQEYPHLNLTEGKQYGFIAQEVQQVVPELVIGAVKPEIKDITGEVLSPEEELLALNYNGMIAILTKGIQEQNAEIDSLRRMVESLMKLNRDESNSTQGAAQSEDIPVIVLNQNVPNPFEESTVISYELPSTCREASIRIFSTGGTVIQDVPLKTYGKGEVVVYGQNLSSGVYYYSLFADGQLIATKKMMKQ